MCVYQPKVDNSLWLSLLLIQSVLLSLLLCLRTRAQTDNKCPALWLKVDQPLGKMGRKLEEGMLRECIALAPVADWVPGPEVSRSGQGLCLYGK